VGIVIPLVVSSKNEDIQKDLKWISALPCSLLHDLGTFCIVLSLTRALFLALDIWDHKALAALRRLWGWILVFLPIPGYLLAGFMVSFEVVDASQLQMYNSKLANEYSNVSYAILRANLGALGGTLLAMAPCFAYVFVKRRPGRSWASVTATATAVIYLPTLVLMLLYLVNDMFRFIPNQNPTMVQHYALSLVPEILVVAMWMFLARCIGNCDKEHMDQQESVRILKAEQWADYDIQHALLNHVKGEKLDMENYLAQEETNAVQIEGVYGCTKYRLERLQDNYKADPDKALMNYNEEEKWLIEDCTENAMMIAKCVVLSDCHSCAFFGRRLGQLLSSKGSMHPAFSSLKTAQLLLEAMKKDEAMKILTSEEMNWAVNDIVRIHLT
jgi:hypothetical protein